MEYIPKIGPSVLVVDDDEGLLGSIRATLVTAGLPEPALLSDSRRVPPLLREHAFQVVLLDLIMPHIGGMELLRGLKEEAPQTECVVITAVDEVATAVKAMQYGAFDYLVKPLEAERLCIAVRNALERHHLRHSVDILERTQSYSDLRHAEAFEEMVAEDPSMALVLHQAELYGGTDYTLMISGETGVGKGLLAHIIHRISPRAQGPFVPVSLPSLSRTLFEDALFGHTKGAYTGAAGDRKGFLEAARGGTLFLDEIAELDPELQGKLLRVIQEKEFCCLGSTESVRLEARIISATNRDLHEEIAAGRFRRDLYYRLNMCHIRIPPLRERKGDILPLATRFLRVHAGKCRKTITSLSPDIVGALLAHDFPGNVRELEGMVASAVLSEQGRTLGPSSVNLRIPCPGETPPGACGFETLLEMEKRHILRVLAATGQNRTHAARILGIGLRTLQRKLKGMAA